VQLYRMLASSLPSQCLSCLMTYAAKGRDNVTIAWRRGGGRRKTGAACNNGGACRCACTHSDATATRAATHLQPFSPDIALFYRRALK